MSVLSFLGILVLFQISFTYVPQPPPCAYWCEATCAPKNLQFYCCSYHPSLVGPTKILNPPCNDLCKNRTNQESHLRNCKQEIDDAKRDGTFRICTNFRDCNPEVHDLCCKDNCLIGKKICVKL